MANRLNWRQVDRCYVIDTTIGEVSVEPSITPRTTYYLWCPAVGIRGDSLNTNSVTIAKRNALNKIRQQVAKMNELVSQLPR